MKEKKVLIFDDDEGTREEWRDRLRRILAPSEGFEIEIQSGEELDKAIDGLEGRRKAARENAGIDWNTLNLLDSYDIFFIDYDLLYLSETGEHVAYLARCYSRCGLIIALNQFGDNTFDLTLKGHLESFADLNLGSKQLDNPGLWRQSWVEPGRNDPFRPWAWPLLPQAAEAFERRVAELRDNLDQPILDFLGFPKELAQVLPRTTLEFIQAGNDVEATTFRQFVTGSGHGLRPKDKADDEAMARIAAARVAKWLERLVLAGQDILVDAPHLVSRLPGLLDRAKIAKLDIWNATANLTHPGFDDARIADFRFGKKDWLSRPAWFWRTLNSSEIVDELGDVWEDLPDFVFCEDQSTFRSVGETREFVADVPSPFVRRFVGPLEDEGPSYRPSVRFSL